MEDFGGLPDLFGGQNQFAQNPFDQSFGGVSSIPLDLQTELKRLSLAPKTADAVQPQAQQSSGFNPMSLLGLGAGGGVGGGGAGVLPSDPGAAAANSVTGLIGSTSVPAAIMAYLYRSGLAARFGQNVGEHLIMPVTNFGGRASLGNQVTQVTNTLFGGDSGNTQANTNNLAQLAINNMRTGNHGPSLVGRTGLTNITSFPIDVLRANGATDAELRAWGLLT